MIDRPPDQRRTNQPPDQTRPDDYPFPPGEIETPPDQTRPDDAPRLDNAVNLLYCNRNPHGTPCYICRMFIGRVFMVGTQPKVPVHPHCYCYYIPTARPVTW